MFNINEILKNVFFQEPSTQQDVQQIIQLDKDMRINEPIYYKRSTLIFSFLGLILSGIAATYLLYDVLPINVQRIFIIYAGLIFTGVSSLVLVSRIQHNATSELTTKIASIRQKLTTVQKGNMRRLGFYRSRSNRVISGLIGGFANYFDIDASPLRLGALALMIVSGGSFIFVYLILSMILQKEPAE